MLTREAFNALLKTLEEPPEHVKFIFATTEVERLPATIVSRCQRFDFRNIPTRLIAEHLENVCKAEKVGAEPDALFRIARAATGSMRDGLSLLDQLLAGAGQVSDEEVVRILGTPADERTIAVARAIGEADTARALGELGAVLDSGVTVASAVEALGDVFRNMMIAAACGADSDLIELPDQSRKDIAELAGKLSVPALVQAVGILQGLARNVRTSSLGRALAEAAVVRLAEAEKFIDPESLVQRLEELGSSGVGGLKKNLIPPAKGRAQLAAGTVAQPTPAQAGQRRGMADRPGESAENGEYVGGAVGQVPARLSTAEKNEIDQDPAVRTVIDLFGGTVTDRKVVPAADTASKEQAPATEGADSDVGPDGRGGSGSPASETQQGEVRDVQ